MKINYFENVTTLEELKKAYREYAVKLHPDNGGNEDDMKELNAQYDKMFVKVKDKHKTKDGVEYTKETQEAPEYFKDIIEKLIKLNVHIEIMGSFIWVSGNTKEVKDDLKAMGFKWHTQKLNWYLPPAWYVKKSKKKYTMDEIREMFGVQYEHEQTENTKDKTESKPTKNNSEKKIRKAAKAINSNQYYEQTSLDD